MTCNCNDSQNKIPNLITKHKTQTEKTNINTNTNIVTKFEKLSLDNPSSTKIMAGYAQFTIKQLEDEIDNPNSEIGKKLKSVEKELEKY